MDEIADLSLTAIIVSTHGCSFRGGWAPLTYLGAHMSKFLNIKNLMLSISNQQNLPEVFRSDLDLDFERLKTFDGHQLIWLLRTAGTVLVPINVGVNPVYITHWIPSDHGQRIEAYLIDTRTSTMEPISLKKAKDLISRPPHNLSILKEKKELPKIVDAVISRGCTLGLWGVFNSPSSLNTINNGNWSDWISYFSSSGNTLMTDFIDRAIRLSK